MGKGEEESENEDSNESSPSEEEKKDIEEETEDSDNQETTPSEQTQEKPEDNEEVKKDVNDLRKVIKLNQDEEDAVKEKKPKKTEVPENEELSTRDSLEQKRAILQSIKDFDFQIKKNSEDLTSVNKKLDSVTKDLDDLVSLYEIVSEQMNPFVGLSKVTKKRIEALENFTKEVDDLKNRMNDIEAFAETAGGNLEALKEMKNIEPKNPVKTNITDNKKQESVEIKNDLPVDDLDIIIEKSLTDIDLDKQIDMIIDDFIENLFT